MSVETIATAVTAALASGAAAGASDTAKKAIADAYSGLKALLVKRLGTDSPVTRAVEELENDPQSRGYQVVLAEKLASSQADAHPEIVLAAQSMLELLKSVPQSAAFTQTSYGAGSALSGHQGTSTTTNYFGADPAARRQ